MTYEEDRRAQQKASHIDLGMRCIKYLLCAVNFLFFLTGMMIISIGGTILARYEDFSHFLDVRYISPAMLLTIIGMAILVIAVLGCYGAIKESTCMVLVFAVSLFLILFLEFSVAMTSYAYRGKVASLINAKINETMHAYEMNDEAREAVDYLQEKMYCCGYNGPKDWEGILQNSSNKYNVPSSCCDPIVNEMEHGGCSKIFEEGCYNQLAFLVNRSALYVITGAIMIALLQLSGIIFACILGRSIRYQKTLREIHQWQQHGSPQNEPLQRSVYDDMYVFI